jgi:hypothetical protein
VLLIHFTSMFLRTESDAIAGFANVIRVLPTLAVGVASEPFGDAVAEQMAVAQVMADVVKTQRNSTFPPEVKAQLRM